MCNFAGVNVLAENDLPSFVLVNAIFLLGTFFFAVVLGVVSDDIGNELKVDSLIQINVQKQIGISSRISYTSLCQILGQSRKYSLWFRV